MKPSHTHIPNRSFGWQELAMLYCPGIASHSAVKRLGSIQLIAL
ncbi:MAG: DUF4248 domain-containing protein [Tannerellaceae bacterium]|nr:DUF4248 domain-containing protein [Tannerellaceae bacterium]